jgi:hypothetical protein
MRKCAAGPLQSVTDGQIFSGWGFVIYDDRGEPRLTLSYSDKKDAELGHAQVEAAFAQSSGHRDVIPARIGRGLQIVTGHSIRAPGSLL